RTVQPVSVVEPVLATVTSAWNPPGQVPTARYVAVQVPGPVLGGALDGGVLDGGVLDGGALDGGALDGGALDGGGLVLWNWVKKLHTSALVQVRSPPPLSAVEPSTGAGVCPASNAAQTTG